MRSLRGRARVEAEDDTSNLAGWMYADLLLALMVIFLATISFVPNLATTSDSVRSQVKQISSGYNYNKGLSLVYDGFDGKSLESDISRFKEKEGLPADAEIIYAQILGGFKVNKESAEAGKVRALDFSVRLSRENPDLFANASINLGSSVLLEPQEVAIRLTFVARIK